MADKFQLAQKNRVGKDFQDAKKNRLMFYKGKDGEKKAAVSETDLKAFRKRENNPKLTLRDYLNKMQGKTRKKDTKKTTTTITKQPVKKDVAKRKPTTNIFKVKKGDSTTKSADAKAKIKAAQKKQGRGLTISNTAKKVTATNIAGAGTGTGNKKSTNKKNKDVIKTGFFPKVIGKDIISKRMRETANAAANNRAPDYMKKDNKKSDDKKRSKSLLKRVTGFATKPEVKKNKKISDRGMGIFFGKNKNKITNKKTTSSYNKKPDSRTAISYKKGGGNVFVARQYGGKIGD